MKNRFVLLVAVLAMVLAITGCSTSTTEVEAVEQELPVETPTSEEIGKTEEVDTTKSEEVAVIKTEENEDNNVDESTVQVDSDIADTDEVSEEATMEKTEQTSQPEKTEVHEATVDEIEPVEKETVTKEESTEEVAVAVEESSTDKIVSETQVTEEPIANEVAVDEPVVEEVSVEEQTVEEPIQEEPIAEEPVAEEPTGLTGTFSATGNSYDDYGWKPSLSLTFENGVITNVNYDEINADGGKKSGDTGYLSYFNQQTGVKLDEVYKTLSKDLLAVQTPENVDSVSGATIASDNFVKLAKKIIADNQ